MTFKNTLLLSTIFCWIFVHGYMHIFKIVKNNIIIIPR